MDNINEDLIYRYIQSLDKDKVDIYEEIEKYSYYINPSKINDLQHELLGNHNLGFRTITNKKFFFKFLSDIKEGNTISINQKSSIINTADKVLDTNNQPFNIKLNLEAFYFHISSLLVTKIKSQKERGETIFTNYLNGLKKYLSSLSDELIK